MDDDVQDLELDDIEPALEDEELLDTCVPGALDVPDDEVEEDEAAYNDGVDISDADPAEADGQRPEAGLVPDFVEG